MTKLESARNEAKSKSNTELLKEWTSWKNTTAKARRNWSTTKKMMNEAAMMEMTDRGMAW